MQRVWGTREVYTGFWWGNLRERDHLGRVDKRIILRWIFRKCDVGAWTGSGWLRIVSTCACSNKHSGSIKFGDFLD
jgi:hypothetical protein